MPKLNNTATIAVLLPLSQIIETGNVRTDYDTNSIAELAESILKNGLLNPVTVKRTGETDDYGNPLYELVCGHRRIRAYRHLLASGQDYSTIPACIRTGSKNRLQLIENIQRQNLTPEEKESAIQAMLREGMTQTEIAADLSKPVSWVSDIIAGTKVRQLAAVTGSDTSGIATKTLSQLRSVPPEKLPETLSKLKEHGGTYRAATEILAAEKGHPAAKETAVPLQTILAELENYQKLQLRMIASNKTEQSLYQYKMAAAGELIAIFKKKYQ